MREEDGGTAGLLMEYGLLSMVLVCMDLHSRRCVFLGKPPEAQ